MAIEWLVDADLRDRAWFPSEAGWILGAQVDSAENGHTWAIAGACRARNSGDCGLDQPVRRAGPDTELACRFACSVAGRTDAQSLMKRIDSLLPFANSTES